MYSRWSLPQHDEGRGGNDDQIDTFLYLRRGGCTDADDQEERLCSAQTAGAGDYYHRAYRLRLSGEIPEAVYGRRVGTCRHNRALGGFRAHAFPAGAEG